MYQNPYMYQNPNYQPQSQILPPQQILTANGQASINALKMSPNSSALIADSTAPIIWKCVSDSLGNVTAEAWDITRHVDAPPVDMKSLEERIANLERMMEEKNEPDTKQSNKGSDK